MLVSLSIRNVVLIDHLDLTFHEGLCVLTGETGAGKSILLDALGLALGGRADQRMLRPGETEATVTAGFEIARDHPALTMLADHGLAADDDLLVLRRGLSADGRSRAFVNDQPVSVSLLRSLGDRLIEIQGRFEQHGLLDSSTHRVLLDDYGGLGAKGERVARLWRDWRDAREARDEAGRTLDQAGREETFLRHAVGEIEALDPGPGELVALADQRSMLRHREALMEAINGALAELAGDHGRPGAEAALGAARRGLEGVSEQAAGRLDEALAALGRAATETQEAIGALNALSHDLDQDPGRLAEVEDRYFALIELARKHGVEADNLTDLLSDLTARLAAVDGGREHLEQLDRQCQEAGELYLQAARDLSARRRRAAKKLDRAVAEELPALKLDKAAFESRVQPQEPDDWCAQGLDRVEFQVTTIAGAAPGPLGRIASAGELSRFLLALKVVLAEVSGDRGLVFDEVDSGIGGATAHAVGERLERLARDRQVLVVTHSPQVAARGHHHLRVVKRPEGALTVTGVDRLSSETRREEIARMLSGAEVTDEARAAAERLLGAA
jgi:DNA repair protein RecN (Recombination protein N)